MGENMTSELFTRKIPGKKMFAFYTQNIIEDNKISGAQLACKSFSKAKLPKDIIEAVASVKKKPYTMNENAERLAKAIAKGDSLHGSLEEMTRKAYIRNVEDLHALRSFAWTAGDYQKRIGTEYENLSEKELEAIARAVKNFDYVNYRGGSYFPGLCSQPDMNVLYIPEGLDKDTKKRIAEIGKTASLNRIRKDLNRLKPVVENVAMSLFAGNVSEDAKAIFTKVLSAWCALAIASKEPFFLTEGPKNYRKRKGTEEAIAPPDTITDSSNESEGSFMIAEIDGELVRIKTSEVNKEETYKMLSESAIPTAVLADAKTILPKLSEFGEIDIQFISKRLTGIEEDSTVANNDSGRERTVEELIAELMGNAQKKEAEPAPAPTPVEPEWDISTNPNAGIEPGWEVTPAKPVAPAAPQPAPVIPEPVYAAPQPAPVIPEPVYVAPQPAPVIPEPVYVAPQPAPVAPEPVYVAPAAPQPVEEASNEEIDEHEAAVRKRMREILEQNKKKQQEKDDVRRQMEERRLEVARKQEQRRQEILAKRRADYENLLKEEEDLKKVVEENKSALMGDRKRKRMEAEKRIFDIEDLIMKEYLDLRRGTNDYHTGLTQEL